MAAKTRGDKQKSAEARRSRSEPGRQRILVVKLGPVGDFALSLGAFAAIRRHHPRARITLLTTAEFESFAQASGYFDNIWTGGAPPRRAIFEILRLIGRIRRAGFKRIYDLEGTTRTAAYFYLLRGRRPEWSGTVRAASHPDRNPLRRRMPVVERLAEQLRSAGIPAVPDPDLSWVDANVSRFGLQRPFALLAPAGGRQRGWRRWPAERFNALAKELAERDVTVVVLGSGSEEQNLANKVLRDCPNGISLVNDTSLLDIVGLARSASVVVANDTGPAYLTALAGAPTVVLLPVAAAAAPSRPRGPRTELLTAGRLRAIPLARVRQALPPLTKRRTLP